MNAIYFCISCLVECQKNFFPFFNRKDRRDSAKDAKKTDSGRYPDRKKSVRIDIIIKKDRKKTNQNPGRDDIVNWSELLSEFSSDFNRFLIKI